GRGAHLHACSVPWTRGTPFPPLLCADAPTSALGGSSSSSALPRPAGDRRSAGGGRVLPELPTALRRWRTGPVTPPLRGDDRVGRRRGADRLHTAAPRGQAVALHRTPRLPRRRRGGGGRHAPARGLHRDCAPGDGRLEVGRRRGHGADGRPRPVLPAHAGVR